MPAVRVTKEFSFEMAHALWNYDGACRNIHGHSYRLFITVTGTPLPDANHPKFGMVIDFKDLKSLVRDSIVRQLDHALVLYKGAERKSLDALKTMYDKVLILPFQPTCENLVLYISETLRKHLPDTIKLYSVKLQETATSFAEWYAEDNT
ncbi:MAG: 6-carboxytetrahydropterin synthase [Bacteroidales bacterium]|nr:6-carboxytetrahydropterin synthase [Bacteroidales bacterium]MBN2699195.1 6-carboxytetrahydropterin synthase [Bacteroidales bacterium]